MKTCPKCGASYGDELGFCLEDGTPLSARITGGFSNSPTEAYKTGTTPIDDVANAETLANYSVPPQPVPLGKQFRMAAMGPANKTGCVVTIGTISTMVLMVFGLGIGGFYYLTRSDSSLVASKRDTPTDSTEVRPTTAGNYSSNANHSSDANNSGSPAYSSNANTATTNRDVPQRTTDAPIPKTISGGVLNGKAVILPKPTYPPAARAVRASGAVNVQVTVNERGTVISASAVSGHPLLRQAATQAARQALFNPTLLSGQAVQVTGVITYNFVPDN